MTPYPLSAFTPVITCMSLAERHSVCGIGAHKVVEEPAWPRIEERLVPSPEAAGR
jgi:hypothetical protein